MKGFILMRKTFFILVLFLLNFNIATAIIPVKSLINGTMTTLVPVYYSDGQDVYISQDIITTNIFYTNYRKDGNFGVFAYKKIKSYELRTEIINKMKQENLSNVPYQRDMYDPPHYESPESISYVCTVMTFSPSQDIFTISREYYLDEYGQIIGVKDNFDKNIKYKISENEFIQNIVNGCVDVLNQAINDPRNAYMLSR